jgi:hypothetical protein
VAGSKPTGISPPLDLAPPLVLNGSSCSTIATAEAASACVNVPILVYLAFWTAC